MQCKANLYFDFTINTCNWPQNVDCQTTIVTNDLEDDSEAPSPTDYKLQDDEKRFNVEGADLNAKKSYHDSYIKGDEVQRGNLRIFLQLRFYVKSTLQVLRIAKIDFT